MALVINACCLTLSGFSRDDTIRSIFSWRRKLIPRYEEIVKVCGYILGLTLQPTS